MLESGSLGFSGYCPDKMLVLTTINTAEDHIDGLDYGVSPSPPTAQHVLLANALVRIKGKANGGGHKITLLVFSLPFYGV